MKKYLILLMFVTIVLLSFISCESLIGYEGAEQKVVGFEYNFNKDFLTLAKGDKYNCERHTIYKSPVYEQHYIGTGVGAPQTQVQTLKDGDTVIIYGYMLEFIDSREKSTNDYLEEFKYNHKKYYKDSIVIIGPSPIYNYTLNGDTLKLTEVNSMCP